MSSSDFCLDYTPLWYFVAKKNRISRLGLRIQRILVFPLRSDPSSLKDAFGTLRVAFFTEAGMGSNCRQYGVWKLDSLFGIVIQVLEGNGIHAETHDC